MFGARLLIVCQQFVVAWGAIGLISIGFDALP
jgi:hypothetical protein